MRKRLTNKIEFKETEYIIVVLMMIRNMVNHYCRILYKMALLGELSYLKGVLEDDEIDDSTFELLHAMDDDVFKLTLDCVHKINASIDSFCNINGVIVMLDDDDETAAEFFKDLDPAEDEAMIAASDKIQHKVDKIFNYLVYFKKAKNYRLYLTVLKYYTLSLLQIIHCLSQLLETGNVEAIAIRLKFGRNARMWSVSETEFLRRSKNNDYNLNFLSELSQTIEAYYFSLRDLVGKKNL